MAAILNIAAVLILAWFFRRQLLRMKLNLEAHSAALRADFELLRAEGLPSPPPNGFNLNRRPDTVRRLRSGQPLDTIAAATGWAVAEVSLLQKVERIASGR